MPNSIDPNLTELLPHRPPMLLLNELLKVEAKQARAAVHISADSPFFIAGHGVPAAIGLEYMGQTAALMAGFEQQQNPDAEPRLGFLLGSRSYKSESPYFTDKQILHIECSEGALVGEELANFNCSIKDANTDAIIASGSLSVLRKAPEKSSKGGGGNKW